MYKQNDSYGALLDVSAAHKNHTLIVLVILSNERLQTFNHYNFEYNYFNQKRKQSL